VWRGTASKTTKRGAEQRWPMRSCPSPAKADLCLRLAWRYDAQIYTNNAATLGQEPSPDVSHSHAIQQEPAMHKIELQTTPRISQVFVLGL